MKLFSTLKTMFELAWFSFGCFVEHLVKYSKHFAHCSLVSAQILKSNLAAMEQQIVHLERDIKQFPKTENPHDKFVEKMTISFLKHFICQFLCVCLCVCVSVCVSLSIQISIYPVVSSKLTILFAWFEWICVQAVFILAA